jgi:hypothetical protein
MVTVAEWMTEDQVDSLFERTYVGRSPEFVLLFMNEVEPAFEGRWAENPKATLNIGPNDEPAIATEDVQRVRHSLVSSAKRLGHTIKIKVYGKDDGTRLLVSYGGEYVPETPSQKEARKAKAAVWRELVEEYHAKQLAKQAS